MLPSQKLAIQQIYSLVDLKEKRFSPTPLAVIGHPIHHSLSPLMHNTALAKLAKNKPVLQNWCYYKFDILPEQLPEALALFHTQKFYGLNLTVPHKVEVLPSLLKIDPLAEKMGAVNTLQWQPDGYVGFNTDGYGLENALQQDLGVTLKGTDVILLGAGGAARAAAVQCLEQECRMLWVANRNEERLHQLLGILHQHYPNALIKSFSAKSPDALHALPKSGTLINATSLGLRFDDPAPIDLTLLREAFSWNIYDMVYQPEPTPLVTQVRAKGWPAVNGLGMLVWQGAYALEIWCGFKGPVDIMRRAIEDQS